MALSDIESAITPHIVDLLHGQPFAETPLVSPEHQEQLRSYEAEARSIWHAMMMRFGEAEDASHAPFRLHEQVKLYALDGIVLADQLGIAPQERRTALQVFALYYLAVHLYDDVVEDPEKFASKFHYSSDLPQTLQGRAAGMAFMLHTWRALDLILQEGGALYSAEAREAIKAHFAASLAGQTRFFTMEQEGIRRPEEVLDMKQHHVSGEATSFLATALQLEQRYGEPRGRHLRQALWYLGSLTQFTDDLRDYEEDTAHQNANLLVSLEHYQPEQAQALFGAYYAHEEELFRHEVQRAGIPVDADLLLAVPWHPFFMKPVYEDHSHRGS